MTAKVTIEVAPQHEAIVRRALALIEEMEQLALDTPDGQVFATCENAVVHQGRLFQAQLLGDAVARRIETAEKKGRRFVSASVVARKKIVAPNNAA
jgi:hypothetical protein